MVDWALDICLFDLGFRLLQVVAYACFSSLLILRDQGHQLAIVLSRAQYSVGKNCLELEFGFGRHLALDICLFDLGFRISQELADCPGGGLHVL